MAVDSGFPTRKPELRERDYARSIHLQTSTAMILTELLDLEKFPLLYQDPFARWSAGFLFHIAWKEIITTSATFVHRSKFLTGHGEAERNQASGRAQRFDTGY